MRHNLLHKINISTLTMHNNNKGNDLPHAYMYYLHNNQVIYTISIDSDFSSKVDRAHALLEGSEHKSWVGV